MAQYRCDIVEASDPLTGEYWLQPAIADYNLAGISCVLDERTLEQQASGVAGGTMIVSYDGDPAVFATDGRIVAL